MADNLPSIPPPSPSTPDPEVPVRGTTMVVDRAEHSLQNKLFFFLELVFVPLALWWIPYDHLPPSGWAVAFIAAVATIMSIHPEISGPQKAFCLVLIGAFLVTELRAINKDRIENAKAQAIFFDAQRKGFEIITGQAKDNFHETAKGLSTAIDGLNTAITGISTTLKAANTTIRQTRPEAYVVFESFVFPQSQNRLG
jgi:hypothetical protein